LLQCLGGDPAAPTDFFSLDQSGNTTGGDWRKVYSGNFTYKDNFAAGTAFIVIRRSDAKGLQLSKPGDHAMVANVQSGMSGWVWTSPGVRVYGPSLTNKVWVVINMLLRARGLRLGSNATTQQLDLAETLFDVQAAIDAAGICNDQVTKLVGTGSETQFKFRGVLQEEKPLRDWLQEVLMKCLGYYTSAFGKLKIGVRENSSAVEAFNRAIFDSLKQQAGGVFDALLQNSKSVWSAIGNAFKTAMLTAIKEVVTSRVTALLMQMFTGQKVSFAGGGAGPGGSGGINWSNLKNLASWKNLYGAMTLGGGLLMLSGAKNGNAMSTIGGDALMDGGIGLSGGPIGAVGGAGIGLYLDAMRRGGWADVGEATAGGALAGWNIGRYFGNPLLGAAIGAGVGLLSGIVRLFVKGASEKARQKIRDLYGVDISDRAIIQQILDIAKQMYGGNIDMAIRTQQVRDLIQLYDMSTGQQAKGMPATMQPLNLAQRGGSLYQALTYSDGAAVPGLGGLPTLDSIGGGVASGAQPVATQLDGPATTSLLQGQAVQAIDSKPRVVQGAVLSASKSNAGRRELASLRLTPGLITA